MDPCSRTFLCERTPVPYTPVRSRPAFDAAESVHSLGIRDPNFLPENRMTLKQIRERKAAKVAEARAIVAKA